MLRREFEERIGYQVSDEIWELASLVYHWYPASWTKDQFVEIYRLGGIAILQDLAPRAEAFELIDSTETFVKRIAQKIKSSRENLGKGTADPMTTIKRLHHIRDTLQSILPGVADMEE